MFDWAKGFGSWWSDIVQPILTFFQSVINGFATVIKMFPKVFVIVNQAVGYVPAVFAVFITLSLIVYIVYMIIGRHAGGTD